MRRMYAKRFAIVFFTVAAIYVTARTLNLGGSKMHTRWFFEYNAETASSDHGGGDHQSLVDQEDDTVRSHRRGGNSASRAAKPIRLRGGGVIPHAQFLGMAKCPVCFGRDLCPQIEGGALRLDTTDMIVVSGKPRKVEYRGAWHTTNAVTIKSMVPSEFSLLQQHVCLKAKLKSDCDLSLVSSALRHGESGADLITLQSIQLLHRDVKKTRSDIPIVICSNEKLLSAIKRVFDEDQDGHLNDDEETVLYSTLASNPELVVLKFLTKFIPSLPFPQYFGSCGRVFVVEGGITPLKDFINEPFHIRASLGAQMLQMVDDFMADEDSEWFVMFTDFTFDNLGVNKDGEVVILDVEDLVVVDKKMIKPDEKSQRNHSREPCNEHCLRIFGQQILHSANPSKSCASIQRYSHLMYAALCQKVLSYLEEHKVDDFFNSDSLSKSINLPYPGLLHDPPNKDKTAIKELLQECVQETAYGGRIQAAEELRDYLSEFFQDDDDEGDASDEEGERNDAAEYDVNETGRNQ